MNNGLKKWEKRLRNLWMVLWGRRNLKKIIRKYPGKKLILSDRGVGDQVFMLAYLKKWASYYHIENWMVLAINTKDVLYKSFSIDESRLIRISAKRDEQISHFCTSVYGRRFLIRHSEILAVNAFAYFLSTRLLINPCIFDFSTLTKAVYRIPQDTKPSKCIGCEMQELLCNLHRYTITDLSKSIVINPYAFSCAQTPISFFQKIADNLINQGFSVICSAVGKQKPLNGTTEMDLPLDEMFTLCNACGMLIGARSGFMDMMAFTNADMICISNEDYEFADLFLLEKCWPQNHRIRTVYYNASEEDKIVALIVQHFCNVFEKKSIEQPIVN